jgi:hypothetical protein
MTEVETPFRRIGDHFFDVKIGECNSRPTKPSRLAAAPIADDSPLGGAKVRPTAFGSPTATTIANARSRPFGSFSRSCEGPATFCGGVFRLNFRDDPGHELRGYFGMRFGCEVDTVEAVVIVRKNRIEDDNRDPTAPQVICYLSDVVGPSFRGDEKTPVVRSRLENHEVRPVGDSGIKACEHAGRRVKRTSRIPYLHFKARGSEHLL